MKIKKEKRERKKENPCILLSVSFEEIQTSNPTHHEKQMLAPFEPNGRRQRRGDDWTAALPPSATAFVPYLEGILN